MLGAFVVPAGRVQELPADFPLTVLSSGDLDKLEDEARLLDSNPHASSIEIKASSANQIERAMQSFPTRVVKYFEITDLSLIPVIAEAGARAKIRTGGITPDALPSARFIAEFLTTCAAASVPFKATAGLHHPLRCYRPLTYAADAPSGWMFGFLNVFFAAVLAKRGASVSDLEAILVEESLVDHKLSDVEMHDTHRDFAISFGSCSFEEPVAELKTLGLI
jgi:hypothetical protein